jgi:hypothetical protein
VTVTGYPSPAEEYAAHLAAVRASYARDIAALRETLATVEAERDALRAALETHGMHGEECLADVMRDAPCTCGLSRALEAP